MTQEEILSQDIELQWYWEHELLPYGAEEGAGCEECGFLLCNCMVDEW